MTSIPFIDGDRNKKFFAATGAGTAESPFKIIRASEPIGTERSPTLTRTTSAGTIASGAIYLSVANSGNTNGLLLGTVLKPGEAIDFPSQWGDTWGAVSYDATGTEFLILEVR